VARAITPDYALGGHTASLGLCWLPRYPSGFSGRDGDRVSTVLEPQQAERRSLCWLPFSRTGRPCCLGHPDRFPGDDVRTPSGRRVGVVIGHDKSLCVAVCCRSGGLARHCRAITRATQGNSLSPHLQIHAWTPSVDPHKAGSRKGMACRNLAELRTVSFGALNRSSGQWLRAALASVRPIGTRAA
jgi:hypothetical protein